MLYFLLIIIAIGVLALSDFGKIILGLGGSVFIIGLVLILGYLLLLFLFGTEAGYTTIGIVVLCGLLYVYRKQASKVVAFLTKKRELKFNSSSDSKSDVKPEPELEPENKKDHKIVGLIIFIVVVLVYLYLIFYLNRFR